MDSCNIMETSKTKLWKSIILAIFILSLTDQFTILSLWKVPVTKGCIFFPESSAGHVTVLLSTWSKLWPGKGIQIHTEYFLKKLLTLIYVCCVHSSLKTVKKCLFFVCSFVCFSKTKWIKPYKVYYVNVGWSCCCHSINQRWTPTKSFFLSSCVCCEGHIFTNCPI